MEQTTHAAGTRRAANFLPAPETRVLEWINLAAFAWWTLLLLLPSAHLFSANPGFSVLARCGDERHWGLWTLGATALTLLGVISRLPSWRVLGLSVAAGLWGFVASLIAMGAPTLPILGILLPRSTGVGLYAILGIASVACTVLLAAYFMADVLTAVGLRRKNDTGLWRKN